MTGVYGGHCCASHPPEQAEPAGRPLIAPRSLLFHQTRLRLGSPLALCLAIHASADSMRLQLRHRSSKRRFGRQAGLLPMQGLDLVGLVVDGFPGCVRAAAKCAIIDADDRYRRRAD